MQRNLIIDYSPTAENMDLFDLINSQVNRKEFYKPEEVLKDTVGYLKVDDQDFKVGDKIKVFNKNNDKYCFKGMNGVYTLRQFEIKEIKKAKDMYNNDSLFIKTY